MMSHFNMEQNIQRASILVASTRVVESRADLAFLKPLLITSIFFWFKNKPDIETVVVIKVFNPWSTYKQTHTPTVI